MGVYRGVHLTKYCLLICHDSYELLINWVINYMSFWHLSRSPSLMWPLPRGLRNDPNLEYMSRTTVPIRLGLITSVTLTGPQRNKLEKLFALIGALSTRIDNTVNWWAVFSIARSSIFLNNRHKMLLAQRTKNRQSKNTLKIDLKKVKNQGLKNVRFILVPCKL